MNGYAKRIENFRTNASKSMEEMAGILELTYESYRDLEFHDDEVTHCISLAQLKKMCDSFGISPVTLLADDPKQAENIRHLNADEFVEKIKDHNSMCALTAAEFADKVGWYVEQLLESPEVIEDYNVRFIQDVCNEVGMNWLSAIHE